MSKLDKMIKRVERRLDRHTTTAESYHDSEVNLSPNGYWSMGYYEGLVSAYDTVLSELRDLKED